MGKIIACVDGSHHAYSVCELSSWVNKNTNLDISLLHVAIPHCDVASKTNLSGSIGLDTQSDLLQELSNDDEAHGKMEQQKGQSILKHAIKELAANNIKNVESLHRRGSVVETILELESQADLIVMGRNGEDTDNSSSKIGLNLEKVARHVTKPLLVTSINSKPIKNFVIAYDSSQNSSKIIEYVANNKLLKNLKCHLLTISDANEKVEKSLQEAQKKLAKAGFKVSASLKQGKSVHEAVSNYINDNEIDLLVIGAYCHSKIRSLILGSTTTALINKANIPTLLFR